MAHAVELEEAVLVAVDDQERGGHGQRGHVGVVENRVRPGTSFVNPIVFLTWRRSWAGYEAIQPTTTAALIRSSRAARWHERRPPRRARRSRSGWGRPQAG